MSFPAKEKKSFAAKLKNIGLQPDEKSARSYANLLMDQFESRFPKAIEALEGGIEDSIRYYEFPRIDSCRISSTNMIERLNREIRRRSSVVGIFPSTDPCVRLVTSYLLEYNTARIGPQADPMLTRRHLN